MMMSTVSWIRGLPGAVKRRMYRGNRPGASARALNGAWSRLYARGWLSPDRAVTLEVRGRTSGQARRLPVVLARVDGHDHVVSMLGEEAGWVRNVRAADGVAVLIRRGRRPVRLVEVPVDERAPILKRYLEVAPGARPHFDVARDDPVERFRAEAGRHPVFRVEPGP